METIARRKLIGILVFVSLCGLVQKEGLMMGKLYALSRSKSHVVRIYSKSIINLLSGAPNNIDEAWSTEKETDTETERRTKKKKIWKKIPKRINAEEGTRMESSTLWWENNLQPSVFKLVLGREKRYSTKDNKFEVCNICETTEQIEGKM